jgi:hypothetical protein
VKAADHRRTPKRKRQIAFGATAILRLRESAALLCRFYLSGQIFVK